MTYSLNTLNADRAGQPQVGVSRFAQEIGLVLGAAALAFWLLALLSHSLADPAWSTTGTSDTVGNWGGRLGAVLADASYYLLGFSVWWCFLLGVRLWLATLARNMPQFGMLMILILLPMQMLSGDSDERDKPKPRLPDWMSVAHYLRAKDSKRSNPLPNYIGVNPPLEYNGPAYLGDAFAPFSVSDDPNRPNFTVPNIGLSDAAETRRLSDRILLRQNLDKLERAFDKEGKDEAELTAAIAAFKKSFA